MTPVTTELLRLAERARDVEGLTQYAPLREGQLGCLFQRERKRTGRLEEGQIESVQYRYTLCLPDSPPNTVSVQEAELLLAGMTLEELAERRHIEAAGVFERIAHAHDLKPLQAVLM